MLYLICQRYKFESESQRNFWIWQGWLAVFNMSKIQIWKRITTISWFLAQSSMLYLICQRYKFESESQLLVCVIVFKNAVFNMSKIQIWKRITTRILTLIRFFQLYLICQRYKFESESQLFVCVIVFKNSCI